MAELKCPCGFVGNPAHSITCVEYKTEVARIETNVGVYITELYKSLCSITACIEHVIETETTLLSRPRIRILIDKLLNLQKVKKGIGNKNMQLAKQQKMKETMLERYGVENYGQLPQGGWAKRNNIPYKRSNISEEYKEYRKVVDYYTRKFHESQVRSNTLPTHCFYTGIEFNDNILTEVNPNDPLKRTIDHRISVIESFINGTLPEHTAAPKNMIYCIRVINNLKSNTNEAYFTDVLLPKFKERIVNESKSSQ
jgi:hypothetical protein